MLALLGFWAGLLRGNGVLEALRITEVLSVLL